jgi:hypothetical protein
LPSRHDLACGVVQASVSGWPPPLERAILDQDPALEIPSVGASVPVSGTPALDARTRLTSFVGRRRQLREIHGLLSRDDVRLVTLTGPPGAGKTRLAAELTTGLQREFPDGAILVELAPISEPDRVAVTIADALGVQQTRGRPPAETLAACLRVVGCCSFWTTSNKCTRQLRSLRSCCAMRQP